MADVDLTPMFWAGLTGDTADLGEVMRAAMFYDANAPEAAAAAYSRYTALVVEEGLLPAKKGGYTDYGALTATAADSIGPREATELERVRRAAAGAPPVPNATVNRLIDEDETAIASDDYEEPGPKAETIRFDQSEWAAAREEFQRRTAERARALWLKDVAECAEGTIYYLDLQLCVLIEPAARPLTGYILVHDSEIHAIDPDWDGAETAGIMKRARAVRLAPDRKGSQGAPLSWDALLALLAYETAWLAGEEDPAARLREALRAVRHDAEAWAERERIEAMPRRTSVNHHTADALTHALTSLTLYGKAQTPEPKAITVAKETKKTAPAVVNAYLQVIQEMPTSRHLTTLHETVLAAVTSLYIEAPYKNILWGDIAYQMGYSDHPREICKKIAQCCRELADVWTVTDWTGAGRIGSLTDEVRGKRGIMWRVIDAGWIYENGEIIGMNLGGRPPANLRFSQQMNNQIDTFPRARLLYGIDTGAGERMTEPKQYIAYKLEDHINTMNRSRKVKAGGTYTVRLIASAAHPERPGLLEEAGVNVNDSGRKKRAVDYVRRVLDGHLAEGTIAGYEIVKEGRKIAAVNITKKGRRKR